MTTATDRHATLIDAGWRCRLDHYWRAPDPDDRRAFTFAAAWDEHTRRTGPSFQDRAK